MRRLPLSMINFSFGQLASTRAPLPTSGRRTAEKAESVFLDEQAEMFTHLIAAQNLSLGQTNLLATTQRFLLTLGGFHDLGQLFLRSLQQFLSFAAPLFSQQRIATSDQPLAWVGRMLNLGQIVLVEQRQLQRAALHQLLDLNGFQC